MYDPAPLTGCYTQKALRTIIDSEANHEKHIIKLPFGVFYLHSIVKVRFFTLSVPTYFRYFQTPIFIINIPSP